VEKDFFIVMKFDADFDDKYYVCLWLMDAFKNSREKLRFRMHPDPDKDHVLYLPRLIARIHPKLKYQVAFCLHLSGNNHSFASIPARSSFGKLCNYTFHDDGFVSVGDVGVSTEAIIEAIKEYAQKHAPPANLLSCIVSGIPKDVMKAVWWAMIGKQAGFKFYPMYGAIPEVPVSQELSCYFGWKDYPPDEDECPGPHAYACFEEVPIDY
jgi:hypothetical protein